MYPVYTSERFERWSRYKERFPGFRRSQAAPCPRVVAGLRCKSRTPRFPGELCICERYSYDVLDHTMIWIAPDGSKMLTVEPYQLDGKRFSDFVDECAVLGLRVWVTGSSPWAPGETVLVSVVRDTKEEEGK